MVDAGGSEQFWPHGYKWALETAKMLADYDVVWFEEALPPDDLKVRWRSQGERDGPPGRLYPIVPTASSSAGRLRP